jgi:hypothetical protein
MYDYELRRNLTNYAIELLKIIVSVISNGYMKPCKTQPNRHVHGYEFIPASMIACEY